MYLVYLYDGDVPFFRVLLSTLFFWRRVSKDGNFYRTGFENMSKGDTYYEWVVA